MTENITAPYINPYEISAGLTTIEVQLLLLCAVVCMVAGLLLAEAHTLRRIHESLDRALKLKRQPFTLPRGVRQSP